jgi:trimethylamine:corrinoid methyltransferase-like protein
MRPTLKLLTPDLVRQILDEAFRVLAELGVEIHNPSVLSLLAEHGAAVDASTNRARPKRELVEKALAIVQALRRVRQPNARLIR